MKSSHFCQNLLGAYRFPVPLLAIEYFTARIKDAATEQDYQEALHDTLVKCCGVATPEEEDYVYLVGRWQEVNSAEAAGPVGPAASGKSFCTDMAEFLSSLEPVEQLAMMTQYNSAEIKRLYCEEDFSHVRDWIKMFSRSLLEYHKAVYEACLYGQGNSYKGDSASSGDKNVIDANSKEGLAMMRQYGIGDLTPEMMEQLGVAIPTGL